MKHYLALFLTASTALAAGSTLPFLVEPTTQFRVGFDTNPVGSGAGAEALGAEDTITFTAGVGFGVKLTVKAKDAAAQLTYAGETSRFEDRPGEDYTTHRLGATTQATLADWKLSGDASALFIDGSRDTLVSVGGSNANSTSLWRERREQLQYRGKFLATHDIGSLRIRFTGTLLDYDYRTRVKSGYVAFADRGYLLGGGDLGWKQSARSLWLIGTHFGTQHQDTVPLPGGSFEYSSRHARVFAGWEGRLGASTTLAFSAGPDFRRYTGNIDERVFHGRNRTTGWFEAALTTKLSPSLSLTAKSTRWTWLSSTGKSALTDLSGEVVLAWVVSRPATIRASVKVHQSSYFPTVRNDWEYFGGIGVTCKVSPRWQLTADILNHQGWNELTHVTGRDFARTVVTLGASVKL